MEEFVARIERYRCRAERLRSMAYDWQDEETRGKVLDMAQDYDQMAEALERVVESRAEVVFFPGVLTPPG